MSRTTEISDLATYLARRDLLTSGFKVFDNKPETYISWKSMFCNGIQGLNLKASEELNLLTKWLDGESLQHALRIRAVHVNNPETGLRRLWQRLDKNYGSSEAIEASLFKRLESFPKIFYKDNHLLQELADLLLELQAAKNEGYLPGLSFLDTSRGINPIVEKLPNNLQEAWIKQGTRYKKEHNAIYPPFSYFVEFVNSHAEMKTDPSFILGGYSTLHSKAERAPAKQTKIRTPITANKTEIDTPDANANTPPLDPDKQCPIHKKPHSLAKCRGFRMKTLEERKGLLKELSICYRCCISAKHRAKDCKAVIHCSECNSNTHVSALHAGPPPWLAKDPKTPAEGQGGEPDNPNSIETSSSCTEERDTRLLRLLPITLICGPSRPRYPNWILLQRSFSPRKGYHSGTQKFILRERFTDTCSPCEKIQTKDDVGKLIFKQTADDDKLALSGEDQIFLDIMNREFHKDEANNWVAPLPFRSTRQRLPNNRGHAVHRLMSLRRTLEKNTEMRDHYVEFMERLFSKSHAEHASPIRADQECWYLPSFGVYHPQKPGKIRVVFDFECSMQQHIS
ncbi:hypothetical protein L3Q82_005027 [Scortum barcoo]|uniref:Uncharacterized protein n=1 Tax=Scortum barcoo TaxID=214431 RepID=A0ACB8VEK2_9TELE|nr:hypothetical protein L3Q82_005027 [Scortum barcoo]